MPSIIFNSLRNATVDYRSPLFNWPNYAIKNEFAIKHGLYTVFMDYAYILHLKYSFYYFKMCELVSLRCANTEPLC